MTGARVAGTHPRRRQHWQLIAFLLLVIVIAGLSVSAGLYFHHVINEPIVVPAMAPLQVSDSLFDMTPTDVRMTVNWEKVYVTVPLWDLVHDHTIWRRMQFEDWDHLPEGTRERGLRQLFNRYGTLATDPHAWRTLTAEDWDDVPQPIRATAIVGMIEYWVTYYHVGASFGLDPAGIVRIVKAVAMSESWFEHRAVHTNQDGSVDIGIGGASDFARRTIRRWHAEGFSDFTMTDDDYYNPWLAARWLAFWFEEMLQEADGDVSLAIRAYNWGIGRALTGEGDEYLEAVDRRCRRYFEGPSRSPTWQAMSSFRRQQNVEVAGPHR